MGFMDCGMEPHDNRVAALAPADTGFGMWRIETHGIRVAARTHPGGEAGMWRIEAPIRDTDFGAAPRLGVLLPVLWQTETCWPAAFQRWNAHNPGNVHRRENRGRSPNAAKDYAQNEWK